MSMVRRSSLVALSLALLPALPAAALYMQIDLVSDLSGVAAHQDANLVNPWGLARTESGGFWVANAGTGVATIYDADGVTVQVADAETLLAMKVFAAQKRGRRELEDLEVLIPAVGLTTVDEVEELFASFYPGDELTDRTATIIQAVLDLHSARLPLPPSPDLE